MQEELITFETAKLAKEKGFNDIISGYYNSEGILQKHFGLIEAFCKAPTQSLLQRWLREIYNIDCLPMLNMNNEYSCHIYKNKISINKDRDIFKGEAITPNGIDFHKVFEEGLQESLKLIKIKC